MALLTTIRYSNLSTWDSNSEFNVLACKLPQLFNQITNWMTSHFLLFNPGKTEIIVFGNYLWHIPFILNMYPFCFNCKEPWLSFGLKSQFQEANIITQIILLS